jgi:hypothetical protein
MSSLDQLFYELAAGRLVDTELSGEIRDSDSWTLLDLLQDPELRT